MGRVDQSAMAGRPMMGSSGIEAIVSRVLELPFIILLKEHCADQADDDGLDNLANFDFEWRVEIERERLRPRY